MSKKNTEEEAGAIDLTPMLDVVFIMLIFFIVTASFVKEPGVEINRPDATTAENVKTPILVAVNSENEIWVNKIEVDPRQVKTQIQLLLAESPKGKVVIQADKKSNIKTLTEVANAARDAGVSEVTISAEN
ncbi:biopolymer transporter ExbD [Teredinibacter sp. KSP-S5-2]|uniref:ExbD/TolR family protein n=1 Tax=Teredinibacter sp. KSP-S5-2 TaxID=3034506 RepID=UPI002934CD14|nr:biopolymer transporter ExbD [Teredinibacter sp. KSP-S5-2]WNO08860.1 biopolymer transporter ExbD [Teredinibacter sp. KSP-S5-2]